MRPSVPYIFPRGFKHNHFYLGYKPTMSTGAAIFADLPETEIDSTGATIFGTSKVN